MRAERVRGLRAVGVPNCGLLRSRYDPFLLFLCRCDPFLQ